MGATASVQPNARLTPEQRTKLLAALEKIKEGKREERLVALEGLHGLADDPAFKTQLGTSPEVLGALAAVLRAGGDKDVQQLATTVCWSLSFGDGNEHAMAASPVTEELVRAIGRYTPGGDASVLASQACATLWNLLTTDDPTNRVNLGAKKLGLLPALVTVLADPRLPADLQEKATAVVKYLSLEPGNRDYMVSKDLQLLPKLVPLVSPTGPATPRTQLHTLAALVNLCDNPAPEMQLTLTAPSLRLLPALAEAIRHRHAPDAHAEAILYACQAAWNMAEHGTDTSVAFVLPTKLHLVMIDVVKDAGTDSATWPHAPFCAEALNFLMNFATQPVGVQALRSTDILQVIEPPLVRHRGAMNSALLRALFIAVFLVGSEEAKSNIFSAALIKNNPQAVDLLLDVYATALAGQDGADYPAGTFCLALIVHAVSELSSTDDVQSMLLAAKGNVLKMLRLTLQKFAANEPAIYLVGGGGGDVKTASRALQALLLLSFNHSDAAVPAGTSGKGGPASDDASAVGMMHKDVKAQFLQADLGLVDVLKAVEALPEGRLLGDDSVVRSARSMLRRLSSQPIPAAPAPAPAPASASTSTSQKAPPPLLRDPSNLSAHGPVDLKGKKHIMVSYAWGARKDLVTQLVNCLRGPDWGFDVWQDVSGSALVTDMQGSTDEVMAEAVEAAHTVVVCVSKQYKNSVNCRLEHTYAFNAEKKGRLKIFYVMMDPSFTSCSEPPVDGWLGFRMGDFLWARLFDDTLVTEAAAQIGKWVEEKVAPDRVLRRADKDRQRSVSHKSMPTAPTAPTQTTTPAAAAPAAAAPAAAAPAAAAPAAAAPAAASTPGNRVSFTDAAPKK